MKKMHLLLAPKFLLAMSLLAITACGGGGSGSGSDPKSEVTDGGSAKPPPIFVPLNDPNLQLLVTPSAPPKDGHKPIIDAIDSAKISVHMVMFLLTDTNVVDAIKRAYAKGVEIKIILNQSTLTTGSTNLEIYNELKALGINVMRSSTGFTITHEKAMLIDNATVYITAMNMSTSFPTERDYGVITTDSDVIKEWSAVFDADVENSINTNWPSDWPNSQPKLAGPTRTPKLSVPSLIWSPVSSIDKLPALIGSASSSIVATVENITDTPVSNALEAAAKRGVKVQLITPQCAAGNNLLDYPTLIELAKSNVQTRIMPYDITKPTNPYMHSKMILVDNSVAYVGSINFTDNSLTKAREAGIIFVNSKATQTIVSNFQTDWSYAIPVPSSVPDNSYCP